MSSVGLSLKQIDQQTRYFTYQGCQNKECKCTNCKCTESQTKEFKECPCSKVLLNVKE